VELNTLYSSILPNLDEMIRVFRNEPINLYVNSIENKTGNRAKLPQI